MYIRRRNAATLTRYPCFLKERINKTQLTSQHPRSTDSGKSAQAASFTYSERQLAVAGSHRMPCIVIADRSNGLISLREAQARLTVSWPFAGFVKRLLQRWKVSPSGILPSSFVFPLRFPFTTQGFRTTNWKRKQEGKSCVSRSRQPERQHRSDEGAF